MSLKHADSLPSEVVAAGEKTSLQVLISGEEGPNFAMRRFTMMPGGGIPCHTNRVEHEQYVLGGRARLEIGDEVMDVGKDDVVFIPAGISHGYTVVGDEPFVFLCVVPNQPDKIEILEKG